MFTSTAEVEGLLKSLRELGLDWKEVKARCLELVVAAHGPMMADGAARLSVEVDLVGDKFDSFNGVVNALCLRLLVLTAKFCHRNTLGYPLVSRWVTGWKLTVYLKLCYEVFVLFLEAGE
ncbi:hypothetical protein L484_012336 [Morus notabilis]|uniref:Uncharacterized protein n=1 Tax=Morus notabilis TaxID=981085 RepID=W9SJT0_9ROSA|nr:hypothetical protein L484_012336 [Morus notabilis]